MSTIFPLTDKGTWFMRQVIVIPGIMGSVLKQGHLTVWPGAVFWGGVYNRLIDGRELSASRLEMLSYRKLEDCLTKFDIEVTPFPYDWRQNNLNQVTILKDFLSNDAEEIIIVAHSMGGLVAKAFLNYFADKDPDVIESVSKLITLGTPWHGSPFAYRAIKYGINIPEKYPFLLTKEISKRLAPKFESMYQLLPTETYNDEYFTRKQITFLEVDGRSVTSWSEVENNVYLPLLKENKFKYTETLSEFYELVSRPLSIEHHEIIGTGYETICTIRENQLGETEGVFGDGDKTVPILSAMSETQHKYFVQSKHGNLPKDDRALLIIENLIRGFPINDIKGVIYDFQKIEHRGFNGKVVRIACPVLVSLTDENGVFIYGRYETIPEWGDNLPSNMTWDVESLGSTTYILFPSDINNTDKTIHIEAYDQGVTSIAVEIYSNGKVVVTDVYAPFEISEQIGAELRVTNTSTDSHLVIRESGKEDVEVTPTSVERKTHDDWVMPETIFKVSGNKQVAVADGEELAITGNAELDVTEIRPGTYEVLDTHYSVNEGEQHLIVLGTPVRLDLQHGVNTIKVFSRDMLGNIELPHIARVFYINDVRPRILLSFRPDMYTVQAEFDMELYNKIGLEPKVQYQFEPSDKVIGNNVIYTGLQRNLKVRVTDIFGQVHSDLMLIDDNHILAIFDGTGGVENIEALTNEMGIYPYDKILMNKAKGTGTYTKLTMEHLNDAKRISIYKDNIIVEIIKDASYRVSFQNLMEDVVVDMNADYVPRFKVYDVKTDNEIRSLQLSAFMKISITEDVRMTTDFVVTYSHASNAYEVLISWPQVKKILNEYWNTGNLLSVDLIIHETTGAQKTLRTQPVILRR